MYDKKVIWYKLLLKGVLFLKKISLFLVVFFSLFIISACEKNDEKVEEPSFKESVLVVNSEEINEEDMFFKDKGSIFLSVEVLKKYFNQAEIEYLDYGIKTRLDLGDFCAEDEMRDVFYKDEISFVVPFVDYKSNKYVNVRFLRDVFDIKVLDLDNILAVFTSDDAESCPNAVGLLAKNTDLYQKNADVYVQSAKLPESAEVYIVNYPLFSSESSSSEDDKVQCYIENIGLTYVPLSSLDAVSKYENLNKQIKVGYKKDKYKPFQMSWEKIDSYQESILKAPKEKYSGLDVLMPSSFFFGESAVESNLSHEYVESAKDLGYLIYAHFSNGADANYFRNVLADTEKKEEMIDSVLFYSLFFEVDGINFDFMNLNRSDRENFSVFFSDLAERAHKLGLTVTLCIPPSDNSEKPRILFNKDMENTPPSQDVSEEKVDDLLGETYIDLMNLQTSVDYFIIMAIDQYDSKSKIDGPVSSIKWVEKNIEQVLESIPSSKLILAQPNYLRMFTLDEDGENVVDTKVLSVRDLKRIIKNRNVRNLYDEAASQDVIEFSDLDKPLIYRVWLEDEDSLRKRLELVKKYKLKGYATWNMSFEEAWHRELKNEILGGVN